jgi:isochorismate synthase EntC
MVIKDGIAYLQAGGGIVYDSDSYEELSVLPFFLKLSPTCLIASPVD